MTLKNQEDLVRLKQFDEGPKRPEEVIDYEVLSVTDSEPRPVHQVVGVKKYCFHF
jgi:hypothetical protein